MICTAEQCVISSVARQSVPASSAKDDVVFRSAKDFVCTVASCDGVVTAIAVDQVIIARVTGQNGIVAVYNIAVRIAGVARVDDVRACGAFNRAVGQRNANGVQVERIIRICWRNTVQRDALAVREC